MIRLKTLLAIFIIVWGVLLGRVYYLTIKSHERYEKLARKNTIKEEAILPVRGAIYDTKQTPLAINKLGFSISLPPHLLHKSKLKDLNSSIDFIVKELDGFSKEELLKKYKQLDSPYNHDDVEIIPFVDYNDFVHHYTKMNLHNIIKIKPTTLRHYPFGNIASHIIGYVSKADKYDRDIPRESRIVGILGKTGLEKYYNKNLEGELGYRRYQVTAYNEEINELKRTEASKNQDLELFLDIRIQSLIHELFGKKLSGAAIVMNANTGAIIAMGSFPEYDINKFVTGISSQEWSVMREDFNHPFINKAVNSMYPPGSVIKQTVALSFLESPHIDRFTNFECTGGFEFGGRNFRCWRNSGHKKVSLRKSLRESCDIYYYKGSQKVGINAISEKMTKCGLGQKTGIDLPNEFIGIVPNKEWKMEKYGKTWFMGETFITSIGQGSMLVTPIQMARNTALIATSKMPQPMIAKKIGSRLTKANIEKPLTSSDHKNIQYIRRALIDVTNVPSGTAGQHIDAPILVAGKTGTAQVVSIPQDEKVRMKEHELEYYHRSHAWMTTYAPANDPKYVVTVLVEHGGHGGTEAGPIVSAIYHKMYKLGYFKE